MSIPGCGGKRVEQGHVRKLCYKLRPDAQSRTHTGKTMVLIIGEGSVAKRAARNTRHPYVCICSTPQALAKNTSYSSTLWQSTTFQHREGCRILVADTATRYRRRFRLPGHVGSRGQIVALAREGEVVGTPSSPSNYTMRRDAAPRALYRIRGRAVNGGRKPRRLRQVERVSVYYNLTTRRNSGKGFGTYFSKANDSYSEQVC